MPEKRFSEDSQTLAQRWSQVPSALVRRADTSEVGYAENNLEYQDGICPVGVT